MSKEEDDSNKHWKIATFIIILLIIPLSVVGLKKEDHQEVYLTTDSRMCTVNIGFNGLKTYIKTIKDNDLTVTPTENQVVAVEYEEKVISDLFIGIIYAYSSSVDETDSTPNITASGAIVRDGVIANNCLPFGTEIEINNKIYTVLDRMNSRYGCDSFDMWVSSKQEAFSWGVRRLEVRVLR